MSVNSGEEKYAAYRRDRDAEEKLLDRFRDPKDPLKIIIVTSKLLTGFDAPILQTMYLDKPLLGSLSAINITSALRRSPVMTFCLPPESR
jgi:type I site-specific restriction-modification system R (restriction) subunit